MSRFQEKVPGPRIQARQRHILPNGIHFDGACQGADGSQVNLIHSSGAGFHHYCYRWTERKRGLG